MFSFKIDVSLVHYHHHHCQNRLRGKSTHDSLKYDKSEKQQIWAKERCLAAYV